MMTKTTIYFQKESHLGYMYRNQELPAALARSQLKRLDEYNESRITNCAYLSRGLSGIAGVHSPQCSTGIQARLLVLCKRYTVVAGIHPPNGTALMDMYIGAFEKVFSNLDIVEKHRNDDIIADYTGSLFRAK